MSTIIQSKLIVAFVADLFFSVQIEKVSESLGYKIKCIESWESVESIETPPTRQLAEPLSGSIASLIDQLTLWQPVLLIFDLGNETIPWTKWIATLKSAPATRRIPVLCFGSHVDIDTFKKARDAGADQVVARSRFMASLPELIKKNVRAVDREAIDNACGENPSPLALKGYEKFDRGEYFEAHETLEDAWNEDESPAKEVYRAILQVGVCYLQIQRRNYRGAKKMILRVRQWLNQLPDQCRGVDISILKGDIQRVSQALDELDPEQIDQFDQSLFRPLTYTKRS
jgi:predicted metal-dependent hydrolase